MINKNTDLLTESTRIALAAFLHDLGKLVERAGIEISLEMLENNQQLYCPHHKEFIDARGRFTHLHAAYTGIAWDALEATGHFPDLRRNSPPFNAGGYDITDSAINAAAAHHRPITFLQWVVATADRVASGFEREKFDTEYNNKGERPNHYCARLLTLFEQMNLPSIDEGKLQWCYPLKPLSPENIFPQAIKTVTPNNNADAKAQYHQLWESLLAEIKQIPPSHVANLPLWLDHFDSLWLTLTHAIPAATACGTRPEVSLYDHSKATAALATALWRWHHEAGNESMASVRESWSLQKFLLVQGDFFGIQDFIFAEGGNTQKHAHKLLRGRSFQVSLLAECAALTVLEALELPSTSQIINAAGKFLIVAPNTEKAQAAIAECKKSLNDWCLKNTYGEIGVGIATTAASCTDFTGGKFGELTKRLFAELDSAKHQRFDLCSASAPAVFNGYLDSFDNTWGMCSINGKHPANAAASSKRGYALSRLADDQIRIGEALTKKARLLVARNAETLPVLGLDYFGYRIGFVEGAPDSGEYGRLAKSGNIRRLWDFDAPDADGTIWRGYARRFVNAYVPVWAEHDQTLKTHGKYQRINSEQLGESSNGNLKTLHAIALEDGMDRNNNGKYTGEIALLTLKGDIDNLGAMFQQGFDHPTEKNPDGSPKSKITFAKMASLSRQVNAFFALWLPWYCEHGTDASGVKRFRNTYTVFAGGDDFFLIGPWDSTLQLASVLREKFAEYVRNDGITFSAGMLMTHPKTPVRHLARRAEQALEHAKAVLPNKNAATLWGRSINWTDWTTLMGQRHAALGALMARAGQHGAEFSTGLIYALLQLSDRAESAQPSDPTKKARPEDAIWRSQLHYRLARYFRDRVKGDESARDRREKLLMDALIEIGGALQQYKGAYRLPLSVLLYRQRD